MRFAIGCGVVPVVCAIYAAACGGDIELEKRDSADRPSGHTGGHDDSGVGGLPFSGAPSGGNPSAEPPVATGGTAPAPPAEGGAVGVAGAAAGMGGEDATEEPSAALRAACETLADAWCGRAEECNPRVLIDYYADPADCRMVENAVCLSRLVFEGMSKDPAGVLATADRFRGDCASAMTFGPPPFATTEPGFFELGAECTDGLQCKSRACYGGREGSCGVCSEPPEQQPVGPEGAPCEPPGNYGTEGFFCHAESLTWLLQPKAGDPCQHPRCDGLCSLDGAPCEWSAMCDGERCVPIGFLGDSCDPLDSFCEYPLVCGDDSRVCEDQTADSGAAVGEDCRRDPFYPNLELCRAGAFCILPAGAAIEFYDGPGICAKIAGMGESCDQSSPCGYKFECHSGTCAIPVMPACAPTN